MRFLIILTIILLLSNNSCSPNLYQLKRFELVQSLEDGYLIVPLKNHSEEIMLLKKYGQHKKAERMARKDAKYNSDMKEAIANNYSYSNTLFTYNNKHSLAFDYETLIGDKVALYANDKLFHLSFQKTKNYENDKENNVLAIIITPENYSHINSIDFVTEANVNENISGYSSLLDKMNKRLLRLSKAAKQNEQNN